ncbi:LytTR family transcriptional regulator DNA-binding domain-containing protein [Jiulongibacter sp. NS-SX5]|uniref:LytTR family transcriptional regulator DNA-binding domain-containing protein n=1 Tax=Jiulongibacter sp. NS-SX5 TaxID=3463854 RepID=UPI004059398A
MNNETIVHLGGRIHRSYEEISYLKAESNYTQIFFRNGEKTLVATTLGAIADRLPEHQFCRVNRSTVVNFRVPGIQLSGDELKTSRNSFLVSRRRKKTVEGFVYQ